MHPAHSRTSSTGSTRRTILAGAAWATPVMVAAAAAPAYAASSPPACVPVTIDWSEFTVGSHVDHVTVNSAHSATTMTIAGSGSYASGDNLTIVDDKQGGITGNKVRMSMTYAPSGAVYHYSFTFSDPVSNLTMTIIDLDDEIYSSWQESVYMTAVGTNTGFVTDYRGICVQGSGIAGDPWVAKQPFDRSLPGYKSGDTGYNVPADKPYGNIKLTFPGPLKSFTLHYGNHAPVTSNSIQGIFLGAMTFTPSIC